MIDDGRFSLDNYRAKKYPEQHLSFFVHILDKMDLEEPYSMNYSDMSRLTDEYSPDASIDRYDAL
jgi:hypothetical protein